MTLTTNGKNWIANTFGSGGCYVASGLSWVYRGIDGVDYSETGATSQIVSRLVSSLVQYVTFGGVNYTYSNLKTNNDNTDADLNDALWIAQNDGSPSGEAQYCAGGIIIKVYISQGLGTVSVYKNNVLQGSLVGAGPKEFTFASGDSMKFEALPNTGYTFTKWCKNPTSCLSPIFTTPYTVTASVSSEISAVFTSTGTPTPTPAPVPGEAAGTFEFAAPPSGIPSVTLDISAMAMKQNSTDMHFEMNGVSITNTSQWPVYIAAEIRLFPGSLTSCPTSGWAFQGMDRVSTTKALRIYTLDVGETRALNLDFYQPASILGTHTVCAVIHGDYDRDALETEITPITG